MRFLCFLKVSRYINNAIVNNTNKTPFIVNVTQQREA